LGFTKLDSGITDSSVWDEPANVLKVFISFWTKCNPDGIVQATYNAIYRAANLCDDNKMPLPIESFEKALNVLLVPDPRSRSKEHDGSRIVRLEESKWLVVTYAKRREYTYSDNPESTRKREQRYKKNGTLRDMSQSVPGHSASHSLSLSASVSGKEEGMQGGKEPKPKDERFVIPPTLEMVDRYCKVRNNGLNAQKFVDSYAAKGWKIGKNKMVDWQAAVRTWEGNGYDTRICGKLDKKNTAGKPGYDAAGNALGAQAKPGEFAEGIRTLDGVPEA
jgi:hypothetical protein